MNNKKLVIGIITLVFIGVTGLIYSLGAVKEPGEDVTFSKDAKERENFVDVREEETKVVQETKEMDAVTKPLERDEPKEDMFIYVHICGEVKKPDVYAVKPNARVIDLIKLAGGFTKKADKDYLNQASLVTDGEKLYIPSKEEVNRMNITKETMTSNNKDGLSSVNIPIVNINTASMEELMTLTGIGEAKAKSIIAYREENGTFRSIEELKNIEGIKDGVFQKIRDLITVD